MISRILTKKASILAEKFPVLAITGPRQSGKTTLAKNLFPHMPYVSLEDPDTRENALADPRGFLSRWPEGAILDEIQRTPEIFSYLQTLVDQAGKSILFVLTGSQNFLMMEKISQSLAGRVALLKLLPFSLQELQKTSMKPNSIEEWLFKGMYPAIYDKKIAPFDWYPNYIETYLQRDVRLIKNINDLNQFQKFLKMCAARTGQLLNLSSLANDCGITHNTAKSWVGILEASFILYLLQPHHQNFNKRLIKTPKIYFYDTGLVCSLLGIESERLLEFHPMRGPLFETAILSEMIKFRTNQGLMPHFYFWRDRTGNEIDCIADQGGILTAVEIKAGKTANPDFLKGLDYWQKLAHPKTGSRFLIYGGDQEHQRQDISILGWQNLSPLFHEGFG